VLVVDDDADTCELIDFILKEYGADVTWVTSATEALDAIAPIKPAVLISDLGMPERDGYWLIRQVRGRDNGNGKLPAVALTAFAREEDRDRALQAGFQMHLASAHRTRAVGDGADVSGGKNILNLSLVICHWSFVIGHLSLVVCHWSLVG
jgi:CheY-like chemotaxis protein